jgi:hypothetical protein
LHIDFMCTEKSTGVMFYSHKYHIYIYVYIYTPL